jgi:hypothetical protein
MTNCGCISHRLGPEAQKHAVAEFLNGGDWKIVGEFTEIESKFGGKDYPVTGGPTSDMRSHKKISDRVLKLTVKKDGKVTVTGRIVVSTNSKSQIVTTGEAGAEGKNSKSQAVYDKQ